MVILKNNSNLGIYAENIAFYKYKDKKTILGAKLNINNYFAVKQLFHKNVVAIMASPEIDEMGVKELQKHASVPILRSSFQDFDIMTFVHCPIKTIWNNNCADCKYCDNIIYKMDNGTKFKLNRYKISACYFTLTSKK